MPTSKCHDDDSPPFLSRPPLSCLFYYFSSFFSSHFIRFDSFDRELNWIPRNTGIIVQMRSPPRSYEWISGIEASFDRKKERKKRERERWEMIKRIEEEGVKRMDIEAKTEERRWIEVAQFGWLNWPRVYVEERVTGLWQRPWFMRVNASPREAALNSSIHPFKRPFFSGKWTSLER